MKSLNKMLIVNGCRFGNFNIGGYVNLVISPSGMKVSIS